MLYVCVCNHFIPIRIRSILNGLGLFFSIFILACGGPPQFADEGSETPAVLAISSDTVINYPDVVTGFSYPITLTIENQSTTVPANTIAPVSNLSLPFSYTGGSFPGATGDCTALLNPGATCSIVLDLSPTVVGNSNSSITLNYFDGLEDQSLTINLTATARDPYPASLSLTPTGNHDFGVIAIGGFAELEMTLENTGEEDATAVTLMGLSNPFSIVSDTCGATIAPTTSCTFTVRFTPTSQAVFNQTLSVVYFDSAAVQSVNKNFSGEGRVAGFLSVDEGLNFDYRTISNGFSSDRTLTVRNTGGGNATAIAFSGLAAPYSEVSNTCPAVLVPGGSCTLIVRYSPTATTISNDVLDVDYFDGFNNQTTSPDFTGQGFNNAPTMTLVDPAGSPSNDSTPTIQVGNLINGITVRLYQNAGCGIQNSILVSAGSTLDFTPLMPEGTYRFHARIEDSDGNLTSCSAAFVDYEYDNTRPNPPSNITFAVDYTTSATASPTINWTASTSGDVIDYQVGISANPVGGNSEGGFTSKGNVTSAVESGLSLTECNYYYASVQSEDDVGLVSATFATSATRFRYDSAIPTTPSALNEDGDGSVNNSATVSWNASTDACGLSHYEVAVSEDTNSNNVLDPGEIGNAVAFSNVGLVTSHRYDSITLTNGVAHFTSVRAVDTTGRISNEAVSDPWIVYDPSIELPDMIVWLDANDPTTILDSSGRDALDALFNGEIQTWLDKSGSATNHHFTAVGSTTRPDYDAVNFTVEFDGANTVMTTANHPEINTATVVQRNITVAFRASTDVNTRQVLYEEGGNIRGMNVYIFNGRLYCGFYNDPGSPGGTDDPDIDQPFTWVSTPISSNSNYFVTWVFDYTDFPDPTGDLVCYVNGASIGATTTTSRLFAHSGAVGLGEVNGQSVFEDGSIPSSGHNFLGSMYEVMLFNNAPDAADVTNVHTYLDNKWN